jgi:DNA-binding MarR family transcriptional regulator
MMSVFGIQIFFDPHQGSYGYLEDRNLRPEALGLLVFLLSRDPASFISIRQIGTRFGCCAERVRRLLKMLQNAGYVRRKGNSIYLSYTPKQAVHPAK